MKINFTHEYLRQGGYKQIPYTYEFTKELPLAEGSGVVVGHINIDTTSRCNNFCGMFYLQDGEYMEVEYKPEEGKSLKDIENFFWNIGMNLPQVRYTDKQGE